MEYKSKTEHFKGYVDIKCQGTSSMGYPKKNYTIKMFTDSTMSKKVKKDFKGWGKQSKFCLKANYIDHSHARNICSAKLWNQIVASRENYALLPELLRTSPCNGAIDGFPIKVYYNNNYEGIYTWNIPKDKWMFNMDDTLDNHCVLCGEEYNSGCFLTANARAWSDEIHDTMPTSIVTSFNAFQNFVINSTDNEFKANLKNYVYVDSLIDYYIFQYVICGLDAMGKNQLFATYDGTKWIATSYDMDSTFGLYWNGQRFVSATYRMQEDYESGKNTQPNKLYVRLEKLFINEIKARYNQLRADILSYNNIVNTFEPFMDIIGKDLYAEDLTIYTGIPSGSTNNIQQIRNYYRDRLVYVDAQIDKLLEAIPCTNISLNKTTLSFTTTDTQTLTATVTPTNTTDTIVWSVSPSGICTVNNGVVTPTSNGQCTITATCGTKTATCNITVNLPVVAVTALNLDKDNITLGDITETVDTTTNLFAHPTNVSTAENGNVLGDVTLEKGVYKLTNIDGGTLTWLGVIIDGVNFENANNTDDRIFALTTKQTVTIHAYPDNVDTNTISKLGVYQQYALTDNVTTFVEGGNGYVDLDSKTIITSTNDKYSEPLTVDPDKRYIIIASKLGQINILHGEVCEYFNHCLIITGDSTIQISVQNNKMTLNDIKVVEVTDSYKETALSAKLTATLTPTNATNKNVTWTANNENIQLVPNGLNCTVKAKAVGNSVVTCTSQDTTNGTISDTCNVTVNAIPEQSSVLYTLPQETTFNGTSDYIDTDIQLFKADKDFTIAMDVTADTQVKAQTCIIHCMEEKSPYPGINLQLNPSDAYFYLTAGNNQYAIRNLVPVSQRTKLVIVKNGTTMKAYNSNNVSGQSAYNFASINQTLLLGAYQTVDGVKGRFFNGTIHEFKISNTVYTDEQINAYLGITNQGRVFKIDSTCMNTTGNKLTDSIGGIEATLGGAPTVSNNQIVFTENDNFSFNLTSLNLTRKNRTLRVKFTPTSLDNKNRCVYTIGKGASDWNNSTCSYITDSKSIIQHGAGGISDNTVGSSNGGLGDNRLPNGEAPSINTEYEIVISEEVNTNKIRWFINGTLIQNGTVTLYNPLFLANTEGNNRFIGSYSLIEIYDEFCDTYEDFTNIKDN